ncbi:MAG: hypothetical protein WCD67_19310, partial [Xanthobacteraceae bacterium]
MRGCGNNRRNFKSTALVSKPPRHNRRNRARLIAIGRKPAIELPQHNLGRKPNMIENRKLPSRRKVIKAMGVG